MLMSHENTIWVAYEKLLLVQDLNTFYQMGFRILFFQFRDYIANSFNYYLIHFITFFRKALRDPDTG